MSYAEMQFETDKESSEVNTWEIIIPMELRYRRGHASVGYLVGHVCLLYKLGCEEGWWKLRLVRQAICWRCAKSHIPIFLDSPNPVFLFKI